MFADVPGIGALDHRNACVVIDRDDADRHAGEDEKTKRRAQTVDEPTFCECLTLLTLGREIA